MSDLPTSDLPTSDLAEKPPEGGSPEPVIPRSMGRPKGKPLETSIRRCGPTIEVTIRTYDPKLRPRPYWTTIKWRGQPRIHMGFFRTLSEAQECADRALVVILGETLARLFAYFPDEIPQRSWEIDKVPPDGRGATTSYIERHYTEPEVKKDRLNRRLLDQLWLYVKKHKGSETIQLNFNRSFRPVQAAAPLNNLQEDE